METIGLQQWNNPDSQQRRWNNTSSDEHNQRRRSRGGRGRRRSEKFEPQCALPSPQQQPVNESTIMPFVRASRETVETLSQLQRLYTLYLQLEQSRTQPHQYHHVAAFERDIAATIERLRCETAQGEQQELVNRYGLGPVSYARLRALGVQITQLCQRL